MYGNFLGELKVKDNEKSLLPMSPLSNKEKCWLNPSSYKTVILFFTEFVILVFSWCSFLEKKDKHSFWKFHSG